MAYSVPSGFNFSLSDVTMIATNSYSITSTGAGPDNAKAEITILFKRGAAISFAAFGDEKMEVKTVDRSTAMTAEHLHRLPEWETAAVREISVPMSGW